MPFENENTYLRMSEAGKEAEFHRLYEESLKEIEAYFNKEYPNIIDGDVIESKKIKDISPIDGKEIATFQLASDSSVDKAVDMLYKSYKAWYSLGYMKRALIFLKAADMLSEQKFKFAAILTYENGKNRYEAIGDVDEAIDFMRYYAMNLIENQGFIRFTGKAYRNEESISIMKPYGVFGVISPFNFFSIGVGMSSAPLVTGNAVILKPSSDIPLSLYLWVRLMHEAGVPKNVLAFVSGSGGLVGRHIVENKKVAGIVFTGSRDVGLDIQRKSIDNGPKVVITEMGGKDAIIVSNKADMDKAVEGVVRAAFGFAGQKCSACSLLYVHKDIYDEFMKRLKARTEAIKPDDPRKKDTFLNPIINKEAYDKFIKLKPEFNKGKILTGGHELNKPGFYVEPTIVTDLPKDAYIARNEIFLPVLSVFKCNSIEEAVDDINSMDYGLTGGIFTEDPKEIQYYFDNIEVGVIYANRKSGGSTGSMVGSQPFVGWKLSGVSGKGTGSFYYLQQFLREQSQTIAH
ncbi:1-pyrroline-5-carboxylate dehydrogenase [Thermoplasma volcanium GSS1]|uniref:L-glutamate gamma-semialdehyde dehydrogenase n=1 Tax=Thermoplasma volcanium (strain ATCC 51530 / DSM 4299 / JCM 9571 / NBRC 15438 / GSS1) TaxID=273116 RepID=Q97B07_THEVO|nr:aldehyde dehydrogenase family protein [Thermoplasma volcanium]BAB59794.1 1-pyrroline-5-carboxylate dehydrogenase [Thermoplasma volcanium GSS1]